MRRFGCLSLQAAAFALALGLSACDDPPMPRQPYLPGARPVDASVEAARIRAWVPAQRAGFMQARLITARTFLETGREPEAVTALIEAAEATYRTDPDVMDAAGYLRAPLDAVRAALSLERPDDEVHAALEAAEAHLASLRGSEDAGPAMIGFLMQACAEAYEAGVSYGSIQRPLEYQTAYGLALLAQDIALELNSDIHAELQLELRMLVLMWPAAGPVPAATPPPEFQMAEQFARVRSALADLP